MKQLKSFCVWILLLLGFLSCEEKQPKTDIYQIKNIGLLSTTEYTIGKVIKLEDNKTWYKFGDRNILISCKARVKAGVDLNQLTKNDITIQGDEISINLPKPMIISFDMDPTLIKTEMEDVNGFRQNFTQEEKNEILIQGEKSIRANLASTHIMETAEKNAELFIKDFYKQFGFNNVVVNFNQSNVQEIKAN